MKRFLCFLIVTVVCFNACDSNRTNKSPQASKSAQAEHAAAAALAANQQLDLPSPLVAEFVQAVNLNGRINVLFKLHDGTELSVYAPLPIQYEGGFLFIQGGAANWELKGKIFEVHFAKSSMRSASGDRVNVLELQKAYGIFEGTCKSCCAYNLAEYSITLENNKKSYEFYLDSVRDNFDVTFLDDYPDVINDDLKDKNVRVYYIYEKSESTGIQHSQYRIVKMEKI